MTGILNSQYITIKTLNVSHNNTFFPKFIINTISDNISSVYDYDTAMMMMMIIIIIIIIIAP
jgi:hypothetical protein